MNAFDLIELFPLFVILGICIFSPLALTFCNILFVVKPWESLTSAQKKLCLIADILTLIMGTFLSVLWMGLVSEVTEKEWFEALVIGGASGEKYHTILSGEHSGWFTILAVLAGGCTVAMHFLTDVRKPPLVSVLLIGCVNLGNILGVLWILQTAKHAIDGWMIVTWVFPLNYTLISVRRIRNEVNLQLRLLYEDGILYKNGWKGCICQILAKSVNWVWISFAAMLPILCVMLILMILFGQTPDALIKAFTMTADWTFSTQIPPPPETYHGHYLCTVAAGGHPKVVRPLRTGIRCGEKIVVNRQLCIANAFEDLLEDRLPAFHRTIRYLYDKYGYPVSKHITTQTRADIVYFLMKPLEWIFLAVLYLSDTKPESRISMQYTGIKYCTMTGGICHESVEV